MILNIFRQKLGDLSQITGKENKVKVWFFTKYVKQMVEIGQNWIFLIYLLL